MLEEVLKRFPDWEVDTAYARHGALRGRAGLGNAAGIYLVATSAGMRST